MADLTYENALAAMRKAHEAGDVDAARRMAALAKELQNAEQSGGGVPNNSGIGFVNRGIGNVIDAVNPFDDPAWQNVLGGALYTGSASDAMRDAGIAVADREPETFLEGMAQGAGDAAAVLVPGTKALQVASRTPGMIGRYAEPLYRGMTTVPAAATEVGMGALGGGTREAVEGAGGPQWLADAAAIAAPAVGVPVLGETVRGLTRTGARMAGGVADRLPLASWASRTARDVYSSLAPQTEAGARNIASDELARRAGSRERAAELGEMVDPNNPLGLTPAEQTMDPEMLALQRAAADDDAEMRVRLENRNIQSRERAAEEIGSIGGDVADARRFFGQRLRLYQRNMQRATERLAAWAEETVPGASRTEDANSATVVSRLKGELDDFRAENAALWAAVPSEAVVPVSQSRAVMQQIVEATPRAQQSDIPEIARSLLVGDNAFGDTETVNEMHGLYSELRGIARAAMSGEPGRRRPNVARIANAVADALLEDLGVGAPSSPAGRQIEDALAHTRAMHETFDQGAVGRILRRTAAGDEAIPEGAALEQTVGRSGIMGDTAAEGIVTAAPGTQAEIQDYLRSQFSEALIGSTGNFQQRTAATWLRNNAELMRRYPALARDFRAALRNQEMAQGFAARAELRSRLADDTVIARFNRGQPQKAVYAILNADDPISAARAVARTARKDKTGVAFDGVKGAFSDFIVSGAMGPDALLSGRQMEALLNDQRMIAAMRQIYSPLEVRRIRQIGDYMKAMDMPVREGAVIDRQPNKMLESVLAIAAAQASTNVPSGNMGVGLQAANIFASTARRMLRNLTNARARELLMEAVEDPVLFRALATSRSVEDMPAAARSKLAPYLMGGASQAIDEEEG